jgi:hypothetical protein
MQGLHVYTKLTASGAGSRGTLLSYITRVFLLPSSLSKCIHTHGYPHISTASLQMRNCSLQSTSSNRQERCIVDYARADNLKILYATPSLYRTIAKLPEKSAQCHRTTKDRAPEALPQYLE